MASPNMSSPLPPMIVEQLEVGVVEAAVEVEEVTAETVVGDAAADPWEQNQHQQEQS